MWLFNWWNKRKALILCADIYIICVAFCRRGKGSCIIQGCDAGGEYLLLFIWKLYAHWNYFMNDFACETADMANIWRENKSYLSFHAALAWPCFLLLNPTCILWFFMSCTCLELFLILDKKFAWLFGML